MKRILIVDDDLSIGNALEELLRLEGYDVKRAYSGTEALLVMEKEAVDLVLLDRMLPGIDGDLILEQMKSVPIIIVSARNDPEEKADLLMKGALDYITKPFDNRELLARIAVQFRRRGDAQGTVLFFGKLRMDTGKRIVEAAGKSIGLTPTEYAVLLLLMQNPTQVLTKSVILDRISAETPDCTESSLKIHVSNLRKKLRAATGEEYIDAVWGIGFKLHQERENI